MTKEGLSTSFIQEAILARPSRKEEILNKIFQAAFQLIAQGGFQ